MRKQLLIAIFGLWGVAVLVSAQAPTARALDLSRFNMKYSNGTLAHHTLMRSIELFGTKVAPCVREHTQLTLQS